MAKVIFDGVGEMPELNRITAKKNYASSSQAHKMGATAMFNDILHYLGKEKYPKLINEVGGQVAVRQHPVYAFQKIPIEGSEGQYNRKFIGLFTVGPDKGDKNYFGFTNSRIKDRAIRLEGTDHLKGVGFNYPWTVNGVDKIKYNHAEESLCIITGSDKTKWTKIWEQSVCGNKETEAEIEAYLKEVYKPAYEVAYHNNPLIVGVDMTLSEINSNIEAFGKRRRVKDNRQYSYCEFWIDGEYDIYYLDAQTNKYEKNGINLLSDLGITADEIAGMTIEEKNNLFISRRVARFKEEAKYYFCIDDAVYQLMFLFIIVASDNFEKNMYPYIMELLWRFFQDDLDSIFSTDNQAQNTKKYSAELHDFTDDTKSAYVFKGEDSAFWQLIELAYADECKQMGRDIFQAMYDLAPSGTTTMEKLMSFFDEYFFNRAQKYFTPSAYNNDTEYSYEEAWNNKEYVASVDIHPLAQALGSQESTERAFLEKRLIYLMSKFGFGGFASATDTDLGIISVRTQDPQSFTLTPAIDLYPTILGGQAQSAVATERVMAGQPVTLPAVGGGNTNVYIVGADWLSDIGDLKDLKVDPSSVVTLTISSKRLRRIKVGDENADSVTSYLGSLSIQKCDSLETIDARNLQTLVGTVDLSNCPRLVEALFGGSNANAIIIAPGSKVEKLQFSDSITTIDLRNNTFLKDVEITNFAKIRFLRLENVPIINGFDVLRQAYNTAGQQLENIRIIGFTYTGNADDLFMLSNIAEGKDKDGNAHNYGSIDANGDPDENSLPVIEGNLHITEAVNRVTYDFVKEAFHALALTADNIVDYFIFADPEVSRIVAQNWGDGTGTSLEQIEAITDIGTKFSGNTLIETFDELEKFKKVNNIVSYAFKGDSNLKSVKSDNVTSLSEGVFKNCPELIEVSFPNLTEVSRGGQGFARESTKLEKINVSKLAYPINGMFSMLSSLKELKWDNINCTKLPTSIFEQCGLEADIYLPNLEIIEGSYNFYYSKINNVIDLGKITKVTTSCFGGTSNLNEVHFPTTLTDLSANDIFRNSSVQKITGLDNVTKIGGGFIRQCTRIKTLELGSKLESIGEYMLASFGQTPPPLEALIIKAPVPPQILSSTFWGNSLGVCKIYVPDTSVEAYKTATNWNAHASRIQSIFYYLGYIDFVDPAVRDICVANFDTDGDGVVSMEEAAAVTDIGTLFQANTQVQTFNEFKHFTGMTELTARAFKNSSIKEITLPHTLTSFKIENWESPFQGSQLEKIVFPTNSVITDIVGYSFKNTGKLTTITFPNSVKTYAGGVFEGSSVVEVNLSKNTEFIERGFQASSKIEYINISDDATNYRSINGVLYSADSKTLERYPKKSKVSFNDAIAGVTSIGYAAFNKVSELTGKIVIPEGVTTIGQNAFSETGITEVVLPSTITSINVSGWDGSSFARCRSLSTLIIKTSNVLTMGAQGLFDTPIHNGNGFVYVSDELVDSYKADSGWSAYASQIKPLSEYVEE